ncbi:AMP-binding protein [Sphingomonas sp. YL-JM2C]
MPGLQTFARAAARRHGGSVALKDGERSWTFAAFDALCDRIAGGLAAKLDRGDRVALFMANRAEYLMLQFAIERAGLVRVPINARSPLPEVRHILEDSGAEAVFCDSGTLDIVRQALGGRNVWTTTVDDSAGDWPSLVEHPAGALAPPSLDDLCSLNYTSGSSGRPKGIMLTHRNWLAVCRNMLIDRDVRGDDILAHIGPLSHASGSYFIPWFLRGGCSVIVPGGRIETLLDLIEQEHITVFTCVPTVLTRIVNRPGIMSRDFSSLRAIGYGAEPIPLNTLEKALALFGPILTQNYGQSEAYMTITFLTPSEHYQQGEAGGVGDLRIGCIGRPYTCVEVAIRRPDGTLAMPGEAGEITLRSEHVMRGYWNLPEETGEALRDGWLWTGDMGREGDDGRIYLVGRRKEMLISGGFNIYPQEIEATLTAHAAVAEAAVVGVADADWGEAVIAFVAAVPGERVGPPDLSSYCKPLLGYRTPKRFILVDELPKNGAGKIDKRRLKEQFLGEREAALQAAHD